MGVCGYGCGGISIPVLGAGAGPSEWRGECAIPFRRILRLTLLGLVCGRTTMAHIALFAKMHWPVLREPLGFLRDDPPHATTISRHHGSHRCPVSSCRGP